MYAKSELHLYDIHVHVNGLCFLFSSFFSFFVFKYIFRVRTQEYIYISDQFTWQKYILNKIINAPCGTLKLLLALGVAKYIKSYKIHFVVQYATDYCPLEHDNYKTISAHLGSPISCYINNLHGAFIFLLSVHVYCVYLMLILNSDS